MPIFETKKIAAINARESVEELLVDGVSAIASFENELLGTTYKSEFRNILKYIEYAANGGRLPTVKMRLLSRPKGDNVMEYEFKSDHLRVYGVQLPNKKIILFCGFKN